MSVYTTIEQSELQSFLAEYSVGELADYDGISEGIENTNYFVNTRSHNAAGQQFVLTIFEHHSFDEMQYYLNLMHHLANHQVPSANPVADKRGHYLRLLKNKPAALVERLTGSSIITTTVADCQQIGGAMGKMHSAGLSFEDNQTNPRGPVWCTNTAALVMDKLSQQDQRALQAEVQYQIDNRDADMPRGVIHADLFRDNALWDGDSFSGIIDFYYACDDVLLYDVAIAVNDWCCNDDYSLNHEKTVALLKHYHQYRALLDAEQQYWPTMLRAGALRFWISRLYDKHFPRDGELVHTKNPDEFKAIIVDRINRHDEYLGYWI